MNQVLHDTFLQVLHKELIPALGCTEPIAIAYAAAKARQVLGEKPQRIHLRCSGNIIKNVKGVAVPNAGGLKGVEAAAILGAIGGDADRELEVLQCILNNQKRKEISETLCISENTVKTHIRNLYGKLGVENRNDLFQQLVQRQQKNG